MSRSAKADDNPESANEIIMKWRVKIASGVLHTGRVLVCGVRQSYFANPLVPRQGSFLGAWRFRSHFVEDRGESPEPHAGFTGEKGVRGLGR